MQKYDAIIIGTGQAGPPLAVCRPHHTGGIMTTATTAVSTQREPELIGQTVVVIGGSAGIGLETARLSRAEGASVILTGRNPERLKRAALELDGRHDGRRDRAKIVRLIFLKKKMHPDENPDRKRTMRRRTIRPPCSRSSRISQPRSTT